MKKTLLIIVGGIALLAVYKHQHVKPIDDPKDSPLFQQRLQSSLDRFQDGVVPAQSEMKGSKGVVTGQSSGSSAAARRTKNLIITGSCGKVTMTWVEEKKVNKEKIEVRRRTQSGGYVPLQGEKIFEREEEGGVRYWASDSGLENGMQYEYLIAVADAKGAGSSRGPVSINLTCTEKDREIVAQREKMVKEYYQKKGIAADTQPAASPAAPSYQLSSERYEIAPGDSPRQGERTLPVTVVVFSDFECIHCSAWAETLHAIRKAFPAEVSIVYKNLPLAYHARAEFAAKAALAAGEQGKFWEMHDILYKNRTALGEKEIFGYAESLGLNLERFRQSLAGEGIQKVIAEDKLQGKRLGVQSIPTSFINGRKLVGAPPASMVEEMIRKTLQQQSGG